eukprot:307968_1
MVFLIIFILNRILITESQLNCSVGQQEIPIHSDSMAIGYNGSSIYLVGSWLYRRSLVKFNLPSQSFTYNLSRFPVDIYGWGQFYQQIGDELLIINKEGTDIAKLNMNTLTFTDSIVSIQISVDDTSCVAANNNFIFVVGGWNKNYGHLNLLQVFNITSGSWLSSLSLMNEPRYVLACVFHQPSETLYAIGGGGDGNGSNTVERVPIHNMSIGWQYIDNLLHKTIAGRAIPYKDSSYIFVIGGQYYAPSTVPLNEIQKINTQNGKVSSAGFLQYSVAFTAPILVNDVVYIFDNYANGYYQYCKLITYQPSHAVNSTNVMPTSNTNDDKDVTSILTTDEDLNTSTDPAGIEITLGGKLFWIIIIVGAVDLAIVVCCIYYIFTKLTPRAKDPNNASWNDAIKEFRFVDYFSIVFEIVDIITDYLFAADLITSSMIDVFLIMLGWISLIIAIFGVILFFSKCLLLKKLVGFQIKKYRNQLKETNDRAERTVIMQEIRSRIMDIDVLSLLNSGIEDLPQTLIVLIYLNNFGFSYISIATISMSILSFMMKLFGILLTKFGCKDVNETMTYAQHERVRTDDLNGIELQATLRLKVT